MRVLLLGILCTLLGSVLGVVGVFMVLGPDISGEALQGLGGLFALSAMIGVALPLLVGLCIVAPLLPSVRSKGLRTRPGAILTASIFVVEAVLAIPTVEDFGGRPILSGAVAVAIALLVFDYVTASRRGARPMTVMLAGFACGALAGPIATAIVGHPLFGAFFSGLLAVRDVGPGNFVGMASGAVAASLLVGLCVVAAGVRSIWATGLRTRSGALLALGAAAGQVGLVCVMILRFAQAPDPYLATRAGPLDWFALAGATALPGLAGTAIALLLFEVLLIALRPKGALPHSGVPLIP